jgi:hypothetical protein
MKSLIVRSSILMTLLIVATTASSARAQGIDTTVAVTAQPIAASTSAASVSQPSVATAPVGVTRSMAIAPVAIPAQSLSAGENVGKTRAMMGVGLAAIVIGIIVGGDIGTIFLVGGAVVGLLGLYRYMQ